jgi:hypothetical protein
MSRRATNPTDLNAISYARCVGAENDRFILDAVADADITVAAWGGPNGVTPDRYEQREYFTDAPRIASTSSVR